MTEHDKWADWLLAGRERGLDQRQIARLGRELNRLRDRVLKGVRLKDGRRVLDVGAGTGLLTLAAARRVAPSGLTVALDISADVLAECRRESVADQLAIESCLGDAINLPFADESFDAVVTRSVLIYLESKEQAVREFHRVLRPGGAVSIFEPINRASQDYLRSAEQGNWQDRELQREHERVTRHLQRKAPKHQANFVDFDERDLVRWFVEAGFSSVRLSLEVGYTNKRLGLTDAVAWLRQRPNPGALSYEEAATEILSGAAADHLQRLAKEIASGPRKYLGSSAYLTARARR